VSARRRTALGLLIVTWLSATGALGTCSFFRPTQPEAPHGNPIFADYSSPSQALKTLALGIEDKSRTNGQEVYVRAYAESALAQNNCGDCRAYHGFFDPRDLVIYTNWDRTSDWNRDLEGSFYALLVQHYVNPIEMSWQAYEPAGNESGSDVDSLLHRKYRVAQVAGSARVLIAAGAADLYFIKSPAVTNRWVIARWQDYHTADIDSAQATLGSLRLSFHTSQ